MARACSVLDVEGIAKCLIQGGALFESQVTDRIVAQHGLWQCHDAVTRDDARIWEPFIGSHCHFGANPANRSCDGGTSDGGQDLDRRITGQDAYGAPT
jgi:hypothetical protein